MSVVIPSKDRPVLVRRAVSSALAQRDVDLEVVVVDDGSEPPVDLGSRDSRVRVIRHETAQGVAAARNRGVREARGRWVAFLDDDDLWSPDKLAIQVADLERTGRRWGSPGTVWLTGGLDVREFTMPPAPPITLDVLRESNTVGSPSGVIAERSLVLEAGGFDPQFSIYADWDLWLRLATLADGSSVRELLLGYVTHDGSMHRQDLRELAAELTALRRHHRDGPVGKLEAIGIWRWIAATQLDLGRRGLASAIYLLAGIRFADKRALELSVKNFGRGLLPRTEAPAAPPPPEWLAAQVAEIQRANTTDIPQWSGLTQVSAHAVRDAVAEAEGFVVVHHDDAIVGAWMSRGTSEPLRVAETEWWTAWREHRLAARNILSLDDRVQPSAPTHAVVVSFTLNDIANLGASLENVRAAVGGSAPVIVAGTTEITGVIRSLCETHGARLIDRAFPTLADARNAGWRQTEADVVAFTDGNCLVDEGWLSNVSVDFADSVTAAATGFIGPAEARSEGALLIEHHGAPVPRWPDRRTFDPLARPASEEALLAGRSGNLFVRRDALAAVGGFDAAASARTHGPSFDDVDLLWRLLSAGNRVRYSSTRQASVAWPTGIREARRLLVDEARARTTWAKRAAMRDGDPLAVLEAGRGIRHALGDASGRRGPARSELGLPLAARELRGVLLGSALPLAPRAAEACSAVERTPAPLVRVTSELPSISVALATYQRAEQLADAMRAFRDQSFPADRTEMIVVVDGSTDGSAELALSIDLPFPVRVVEQRNQGLSVARNVGAAEADGDVLVFWDDDIHPSPHCLTAHAAHHATASRSWLMGAFPPVVGTTWIEQWVRAHWMDRFRRVARPDHRWSFVDMVDGNSSVAAGTFADLGGFDPSFSGGRRQDWEIGIRLIRDDVSMAFSWDASGEHHTVVSYETMLRNADAEGRFDARLAALHPQVSGLLPAAELAQTRSARRARRAASALGYAQLARAAHRAERLGARRLWNEISGQARSAAYESAFLATAVPLQPAVDDPVVCSLNKPVSADISLLGRTLEVVRDDGSAIQLVAQRPGEQWDSDEAVNRLTEALMSGAPFEKQAP